jgi:glutamine cyclotransferase
VYDVTTFKKIGEFNWDKEGWGLTTDGKSLILSDGSNIIYFINPDTFQVEKTISVTDNYGMVDSINELEFVNGSIYANKYMTNYILKISPATGKVEGRVDLRDIFQQSGKTNEINKIPDPQEDVLNGIAYDSTKQSFYITGKQWPVLFEVKLK